MENQEPEAAPEFRTNTVSTSKRFVEYRASLWFKDLFTEELFTSS